MFQDPRPTAPYLGIRPVPFGFIILTEKQTARCLPSLVVDRMPSRRPSSILSSRSAVGLYPALENVNRSAAAERLYPASVSASASPGDLSPAVAPRAAHAATSHSQHVSEARHAHAHARGP